MSFFFCLLAIHVVLPLLFRNLRYLSHNTGECVMSLRCSWKSPGRLLGGGVTDAGASIDFFPVDQ